MEGEVWRGWEGWVKIELVDGKGVDEEWVGEG